MKVYLECLGCERRLMDYSKMKNYFQMNGYDLTRKPQNADHLVLVTCAFREEEETNALLRLEALSKFKGSLLVYGCLPAIAPSKLIRDRDIHYLATKDVGKIDQFYENISVKYADVPEPFTIAGKSLAESVKQGAHNLFANVEFSEKFLVKARASLENKVRSLKSKTCNLSICRGCRGNCSYCAIRFAIGPCKSKKIDRVLEEFTAAAVSGFRRFKIMGDDVGAYGLDIDTSFGELMKPLMAQAARLQNGKAFSFVIDGIHPQWAIKYRYEIEDILGSGLVEEVLCPVQSGNDGILELMKRHHTSGEIGDVLKGFDRVAPEVQLTTQVMVGFPHETRDSFRDTLTFLENSPFDSVTIFPYDDKENTPSRKLGEKVPAEEIEFRINEAISYLRKRDIKVHLSCPHNS